MIEMASMLEFRQRLGDLLNRVALRHDEFVIERKGKLVAAMVPVERLEQMQQAARLRLLSVLGRKVKTILRERPMSWRARPNIELVEPPEVRCDSSRP